MTATKKKRIRRAWRAALAAGVGGLLVGGVLVFVPDGKKAAPRDGGPEGRALAAAAAGAPAALPDLTALIHDREARVKAHPADRQAWAVLGSAYVARGTRAGDTASYPAAERALARALAPAGRAAESRAPKDGGPGTGPAAARGPQAQTVDARTLAAAPPEALVGLATLANARHDYRTARQWAERAQRRQPKSLAAYPALITAENGVGDYAAAGKAVDRFAKARPATSAAAALSAGVYNDRGWREDAAAKASDAAEHATTPAQKAAALDTLGLLAWERGEPKEALGQYDAALQAEPGRREAQAGRGRALAALGRTDEAYQAYQTAAASRPRPADLLELGELYDSLGLNGDAQTQYTALRARIAAARKAGVDENLVLGRFQADHGDPQAAVATLTSEWTGGRRSMEVADALGWALFRAGDATRALGYATTATEQGRRSALFSYHRGEIERTLGMTAQARRHLQEALRTNPSFSPLLAPRAREALDALALPEAPAPDAESDSGDEQAADSAPLTAAAGAEASSGGGQAAGAGAGG